MVRVQDLLQVLINMHLFVFIQPSKKSGFKQHIEGHTKLVLDVYTQTNASYVADQNSTMVGIDTLSTLPNVYRNSDFAHQKFLRIPERTTHFCGLSMIKKS